MLTLMTGPVSAFRGVLIVRSQNRMALYDRDTALLYSCPCQAEAGCKECPLEGSCPVQCAHPFPTSLLLPLSPAIVSGANFL